MATYESGDIVTQSVEGDTPVVTSLDVYSITIVEDPNNRMRFLVKTRSELVDGVFPIKKGGTGIDFVEGGKLIASNTDGTAFEEIDVLVDNLSGLRDNIQHQLDKVRNYKVSIPVNGWTSANGVYYQSFSVPGILESDNPFISLINSSTKKDAIELEQIAFYCIEYIITQNDNIIVYCNEVPKTQFTISINCTGNSTE